MKISTSLYTNSVSKNNSVKSENPANVNKNKKSLLGGNIKRNSILDQLIKQKQSLIDSKNVLVDNTLKNGESLSSINDKLKDIDRQIKNIDNQISKIKIEEQRKALGTDDNSKKIKEAKEKKKVSNDTEVEDGEKQMNSLLDLSSNLANVKILSSEKKSMEGKRGVLKGEIKLDIARGLNPVVKQEQVSEINERMQNVFSKIGESLNTINSGIKNINEKSNNTKIEDKVSSEQQEIIRKIQCYNDNLPDNEKIDGKKMDVTA